MGGMKESRSWKQQPSPKPRLSRLESGRRHKPRRDEARLERQRHSPVHICLTAGRHTPASSSTTSLHPHSLTTTPASVDKAPPFPPPPPPPSCGPGTNPRDKSQPPLGPELWTSSGTPHVRPAPDHRCGRLDSAGSAGEGVRHTASHGLQSMYSSSHSPSLVAGLGWTAGRTGCVLVTAAGHCCWAC